MLSSKPILLVEDDCVDVMAVQRVLKELDVTNELVHAADGEEALVYLRGTGNAMPCIILLDLNMPRMNGVEFLQVLKADEALGKIPVMVVTTSPDKQDMARSFELGVVAYIIKCSSYREFRDRMMAITPYLAPVRPTEKLEPARL
jgi:CheY-like chemotaxis protein